VDLLIASFDAMQCLMINADIFFQVWLLYLNQAINLDKVAEIYQRFRSTLGIY